jgi:hypothetical protein
MRTEYVATVGSRMQSEGGSHLFVPTVELDPSLDLSSPDFVRDGSSAIAPYVEQARDALSGDDSLRVVVANSYRCLLPRDPEAAIRSIQELGLEIEDQRDPDNWSF